MKMEEIDHTNPQTDESFAASFRRGQVVAADGGTEESATETMRDVSHEAPTEGANRTFERGTEGRDGTV